MLPQETSYGQMQCNFDVKIFFNLETQPPLRRLEHCLIVSYRKNFITKGAQISRKILPYN